MSRRENISFWKAALIRIAAVALGLIVCAVVIVLLTGMNPIAVYGGIVSGAVGSTRRLWVTIRDTMFLLVIAIGLLTAAIMIHYGDTIPAWILFPVLFLTSAAAGAVWGMIPAFFKAHWGTNETLFTLMMNYVASQIVNYCIILWENPAGSNKVGTINRATKAGWLPKLFGSDYGWIVIIVMAFAVLMFFYLRRTKHGYEIAVVGESENTARYAGINVRKVIIRTMALSGAICGIAGFLIVAGSSHTISTSTAGGRGFTAIIVAWMSKFNTFWMLLVSFFLVFMQNGTIQIASQFNLSENIGDIITGILLFFIIGSDFFITYRLHRSAAEA